MSFYCFCCCRTHCSTWSLLLFMQHNRHRNKFSDSSSEFSDDDSNDQWEEGESRYNKRRRLATKRMAPVKPIQLHSYAEKALGIGARIPIVHKIKAIQNQAREPTSDGRVLSRTRRSDGSYETVDPDSIYPNFDQEWFDLSTIREAILLADPHYNLRYQLAGELELDVEKLSDESDLSSRVRTTQMGIAREKAEVERVIVKHADKVKQLETLQILLKEEKGVLSLRDATLQHISEYQNLAEMAAGYYQPIRVNQNVDFRTFPNLDTRPGAHVVEEMKANHALFHELFNDSYRGLTSLQRSELLEESLLYQDILAFEREKENRIIPDSFFDPLTNRSVSDLFVNSYLCIYHFLDHDVNRVGVNVDEDPMGIQNNDLRRAPSYYARAVVAWFDERWKKVNLDAPLLNVDVIDGNRIKAANVSFGVSNDTLRSIFVQQDLFVTLGSIPIPDTVDVTRKVAWASRLFRKYDQIIAGMKDRMLEVCSDDTWAKKFVVNEDAEEELPEYVEPEMGQADLPPEPRVDYESYTFKKPLHEIIILPPVFSEEQLKSASGTSYPFNFISDSSLREHIYSVTSDPDVLKARGQDTVATQLNIDMVESRLDRIQEGNTRGDEDPTTRIEKLYAVANARALDVLVNIPPYQLYDNRYKDRFRRWRIENNEFTTLCVLFAESYTLAVYLQEHSNFLVEAYKADIQLVKSIIANIATERPSLPRRDAFLRRLITSGNETVSYRRSPLISGVLKWDNKAYSAVSKAMLYIRKENRHLSGLTLEMIGADENSDFCTVFVQVVVILYRSSTLSDTNRAGTTQIPGIVYAQLRDIFNTVREYRIESVFSPESRTHVMRIINHRHRHLNEMGNTGSNMIF